MKNLFFLFMLLMIISCSANKGVYWCGDHSCKNKKEKEAYFKKTMIVEIKTSKNKNYKNNSEIEKIMQEAQSKAKKIIKVEKDLAKQTKLEEKKQIKIKLEEKMRIKEEKNLAKQIKLEEKMRIKDKKKSSKRKIVVNQKKQLKKSIELNASTENIKIVPSKFSELIKKITKKNILRPYPDINDVPN